MSFSRSGSGRNVAPPQRRGSKGPGGGSMRRASAPKPAAERRPTSAGEIFWRATSETSVMESPFGNPTADVDPGVVVEEIGRMHDIFDQMWVAVNSEDGSIVWLRRDGPAQLSEESEPQWERVVKSGDEAVAIEQEAPQRGIDPEKAVLDHPLHLLPSDESFMAAYLDQRDNTGRDWNTDYQQAIENIIYNFSNEEPAVLRSALQTVVTEFADNVQEVAAHIVKEMFLPNSERTKKSFGSGSAASIYFDNKIFYKICIDTSGGVYGGDFGAMKVASQQHKAVVALNSTAPLYLLYSPLAVVMTHHGYRIFASTIPPFKTNSLVCGSVDGGKTFTPPPPFVENALSRTANALGLKKHVVSLPDDARESGQLSSFPVDVRVHAGTDHRLYIMNPARLFPPLAPLSRYPHYHALSSGLYWRLRPELICQVERPISSDAFVPKCSTTADNVEVITLTQWIRDAGIPTLAAVLSFLEPPPLELPQCTCCGCGKKISEELRFVVCSNTESCCKCCPQCCVDVAKLHHFDNKPSEAKKKVMSFVKCGTKIRALAGFEMVPSVKELFHASGVNLRYMYYVYNRLAPTSKPCVGPTLEVEMIVRAAKHVLWRNLRTSQSSEEQEGVCVNFLMALLEPSGELAEAFWGSELGPAIQQQFDVQVPFDTANIDRMLVYRRVADLTGVELTAPSLESLDTEQPFIQLEPIHPIMKTLHIPLLPEEPSKQKEFFDAERENLVSFWASTIQNKASNAPIPRYLM